MFDELTKLIENVIIRKLNQIHVENVTPHLLRTGHWQSGFKEHLGCDRNIVKLFNFVKERYDHGKDYLLGFIDVSKAFDSVSRNKLFD
jgi:hypothetical protein